MNSVDLITYGFNNWITFSLTNKQQLFTFLPREKGVYIIKRLVEFGRLIGSSDIVYIGSAINSGGLRNRIGHFFHPGPTQLTSQRINALLGALSDLEMSWVVTDIPALQEFLSQDCYRCTLTITLNYRPSIVGYELA